MMEPVSADILQELDNSLELNRDHATALSAEFHANKLRIKELMERNDELARELAKLEMGYYELRDWRDTLSSLGSS